MCDIRDIEYAELWNETSHKARKAYRCNSCGIAIKPGEKYVKHFSLQDGEVCSEKACFACGETREKFLDAHGAIYPPSHTADLLNDCIQGDHSSEWRSDYAKLLWRNRKRAP